MYPLNAVHARKLELVGLPLLHDREVKANFPELPQIGDRRFEEAALL